MKKIILTSIVALLFASASFASFTISFSITFGKKVEAGNCPNFGWCKATISLLPGQVPGTITLDEVSGTIVLAFKATEIQSVQPDKMVYFTGKREVTFDDDTVLPQEFNTALKSSKPLKIAKGTYTLSYANGTYYINIPI